jgi:hypothetical protein
MHEMCVRHYATNTGTRVMTSFLYIQTNTNNKNTVYTLRSLLHVSADLTANIR